ncbi:O-antigen ligase family protein [Roseibacillus persicicus]|uniref:O-antigen ligase family protein n=1 Tax=Roseibacillus persicicus TaxID=454148 RepID=UPI00280EA2BD|nr:O-antigen ligase family protein [Roseibacillus persicicus]MDQ8188872.1 O-antigen ligase family protein [Roseibacillus persicicus]
MKQTETALKSQKMPAVAVIGWLFCLIGLSYAAIVGNGGEFPRIAYSLPFLVVGSLLVCLSAASALSGWLLISAFLGGGYFILRAAYSPVWDLARKDVVLLTCALSALVAGACSFRYKLGSNMFLVTLIFLLIGHGVVAFYQGVVDSSYSFLGSARVDRVGVSGFYYHRNYFAGFLEISAPLFVALAARGGRRWLLWGGVALSIAILSFFSNSRGGFCVLVLGCLSTFIAMKFSQGEEKRKIRPWVAVFSLGLVCVALGGGWLAFDSILSKRGAIEVSLMGRLGMAGIAFDVWKDSPLVGNGSYSYSYLFPKNFAGLRGWYGDAKMAHSDYLQIMAEYGLVGLGVVFFLIVSFSAQVLMLRSASGRENLSWISYSFVGILVAEVVRAVFDFNLHIAPNLILFSLIAGGVCERVLPNSRLFGKVAWSSQRVIYTIMLIAVGMGGIYSVRRELAAIPIWLEVERAKSSRTVSLSMLREYSLAAPSHQVLRQTGRELLKKNDIVSLQQATEIYRIAVRLHPYDGEGLANYASCLDRAGQFSNAEEYHLRAIDAVGRRENKYGVLYGVGWHLVRRGEEASQARRTGEALFLYQAAKAAFGESYKRNFSRKKLNREMLDWVNQRIQFLEGARIEPVEVEILDWESMLP